MARDWRVAPCLYQLGDQLDVFAPKRSRKSDGLIGDVAHQKAGTSDHLPWWVHLGQPYVTAGDWTHDPAGGLDCARLAAALRDGKDRRVKYVIWADRIMSGFGQNHEPWAWRLYQPGNPNRNQHRHHLHLSVVADARSLLRIPWMLPGLTSPVASAKPVSNARPTIRRGDTGTLVGIVQRYLALTPDEVFGLATERAVRAYQAMRGLTPDGVVGPATWREMNI